jgi:PKD repeat protein
MSTLRSFPGRVVVGCVVGCVGLLVGSVGCVWGSVPVLPYGEVARFGGFAVPGTAPGAETTYEALTTPKVQAGKIVDPVGLTVDTNDTSDATHGNDRYAVYVLENVNPQAINSLLGEAPEAGALALEYRIQKFDDAGGLLASVRFTLQSSEAERALQALGIAVDGQSGRVYVLIGDSLGEQPAADRIDVWTTGLEGDAKLTGAAALPADPLTGAGELVGPDAPGTIGVQNIDGVSLAVAGKGAGADVALGGTEEGVGPVIERIFTEAGSGHKAGERDGAAWHEASGTEDAAARAWGQSSAYLNWLSANPDGSFDAVLGPPQTSRLNADEEPNMAWVSGGLSGSPRAILPWADAAQGAPPVAAVNSARAATVAFKSNQSNFQGKHLYRRVEGLGATHNAGVLGPGVVGLSGEGSGFSNGVYAGIVAHGAESSWLFDQAPADLAIRVFDEHEHSLALIANTTPGGPCNLQGGPGGEPGGGSYGSFAALAAGREGTVFALVQSDLTENNESTRVNPANAVGSAPRDGDEIVEFAPGAGQNKAPGVECPQPVFPEPTGTFSIANVTHPAEVLPATGEVTVEKDTELEFNAGNANLQGAAAWEYVWGLEPGVSESLPWRIEGHAWLGAPAHTIHKYENTGVFPTTLELVNDFGVLKAQRTVHVAEAKPCTAVFTVTGATVGQLASFDATGSSCEGKGDGIETYSWNFGDHKQESSKEPTVKHEYTEPGSYQVELTITDDFKHPYNEKHPVTVEEPATTTNTTTSTTTSTPATTSTTSTTSTSTTHTTTTATTTTHTSKPPTEHEKLIRALALCKKKKPHSQRTACEKNAKKKYSTKHPTKHHHKK